MKFKEGDWVRLTSFYGVYFKNTPSPISFGINDIMPEYTLGNCDEVDKSIWLKERYKIIKIINDKHHIRSENYLYNFIIESRELCKISVLEMVPKK